MRGWMLAGVRRSPGPLIGTVVASAAAAALTVAALSVALADTSVPAGRLAGASVVVAGGHEPARHRGPRRRRAAEPAAAGLPGPIRRVGRAAGPGARRGGGRRASRASPAGWSVRVTWTWSR